MTPSMQPTGQPPARKATLYCTDCQHTSRINGDWTIRVNADSLDYECPECGTTIDSRRGRSELAAQSRGAFDFCAGE